jgi:hypothetical protein
LAKISVGLKTTIPGPKNSYRSWGADVRIEDLEVNGEIDKQIEEALEAIAKVGEALHVPLAQQAADISGLTIEGTGLATELDEFREETRGWMAKVVEKLKEILEKQKEEQNGKV